MNIKVLYEDNHIIVVEKPAGILIQRDFSGEDSLLDIVKIYIKEKYSKPGNVYIGLVHRIDKPVSGAVVFARTSKAARRLFKEFKNNRVVKLYVALVHNPKNFNIAQENRGEWIDLKQKITRKRDKTIVVESATINAKEADMKYKTISSNNRYSLLLVKLITGRKHQIRAQLSSIEMPVVGDMRYGSEEELNDNSICLHSCYLEFSHPTLKTPVEVFSEIPERIRERIGFTEGIQKEKLAACLRACL